MRRRTGRWGAVVSVGSLLFVAGRGVPAGEPSLGALANGDVNCSSVVDLSDAVYILSWLFVGGRAPCPLADPPELVAGIAELEAENAAKDARIAEIEAQVEKLEAEAARCDERLAAATSRVADLEVPGCTNPASANYSPCANVDDGSCIDHARIEGFTYVEVNEQGLPEYDHDAIGTRFVLLPGGVTTLGSPDDECSHELDEGPVHGAFLTPFLVAKYEVSQRRWIEVMGANPSGLQPGGARDDLLPEAFRENDAWLELPVERITWQEARLFCERVGLELPSEAQCRAPDIPQ